LNLKKLQIVVPANLVHDCKRGEKNMWGKKEEKKKKKKKKKKRKKKKKKKKKRKKKKTRNQAPKKKKKEKTQKKKNQAKITEKEKKPRNKKKKNTNTNENSPIVLHTGKETFPNTCPEKANKTIRDPRKKKKTTKNTNSKELSNTTPKIKKELAYKTLSVNEEKFKRIERATRKRKEKRG